MKLFESREESLTPKQRKRILTLHAQFGDQMIPTETTTMHGAHNVAIPSAEHNLSIFLALSSFSKLIIKFLKS